LTRVGDQQCVGRRTSSHPAVDDGDNALAADDALAAANTSGSDDESGAESPGVSVEGLEEALVSFDWHRLTFERGTDQLTPDGLAAAADIAAVLVAHPFIAVEVEIRTFTEATPGENQGLSVLQAEAVVSTLSANGVDPERMTAIGLGGSFST